MIAPYFGFAEDPFGATPDPRFLYSSRTHREALASLHYAFRSNRGFTALIAPPGMGKTTLLFEFLERVRDTAQTAFLFNSQCQAPDLLREIVRDIGLAPGQTLAEMLQQLNAELLETARQGRRLVVIVDEAQNLDEPALEMLRLLTNFETARAKLMQIVLSGQLQLEQTLLRPGLIQLRQRIATFCNLEPLSPQETDAYITHRLWVAGYRGGALFSSEALRRITEASQGIPRNINTICFNALSLCCGLRHKQIDVEIVSEVLHDLRLSERGEEDRSRLATAASVRPALARSREGRRRLRVSTLAGALILAAAAALWIGPLRKAHLAWPSLRAHPGAAQPGPSGVVQRVPAPVLTPEVEEKVNALEITVDPKETLSGISVRTVGVFDSTVLRQIQELNPDLVNPDLIVPGQKILFPERTTPRERTDGTIAPIMRK